MGHEIDLKQIMASAGGYKLDAYRFIRDGLAHTVQMVHGTESMERPGLERPGLEDETHHVSGRQLCMGLRDYAIDRWGKMARLVLARWNIHETADFGRIVFAMVDAGLMRKTDDDSMEDFVDVFEFDEAFALPEPRRAPSVQVRPLDRIARRADSALA